MPAYTEMMGATQAAAIRPKKRKRRGLAAGAPGISGASGGVQPAASGAGGALGGFNFTTLLDDNGDFDPRGVLGTLQGQWNEARAANEGRYAQALGLGEKSRTEALGYLDRYGESAKGDIDRDLQDRLGGIDQDAISRGIYNFTTKDALGTMARESAGRQRAAVDERANTLRADVSTRGYQSLIDLMAGREDPYPDVGGYLGLIERGSALKSEKAAREQDRAEIKAERLRAEGQRIVHTDASRPGQITEYYADGTSKTFVTNPQLQDYYRRTFGAAI